MVEYLTETIEDLSEYAEFYEMANYETRDSGLPCDIWFDELGAGRKNKHTKPRVKIAVDSKLVPVLVSSQPEIPLKGTLLTTAEKIFKGSDKKTMLDFIARNHELILSHWNGDITTKTLLNKLR